MRTVLIILAVIWMVAGCILALALARAAGRPMPGAESLPASTRLLAESVGPSLNGGGQGAPGGAATAKAEV